VHCGVSRPGPLSQPVSAPGRGGELSLRQSNRRGRLRVGRPGLGCGGGAKAVMVRGYCLLRGFAEVLPQVEPVGTSRQDGMASSAAGLDPGRPASASATLTSAPVIGGCGRRTASRRTCAITRTLRPPSGRSWSRRR
jgi:hypothetical protein